jgi:hypothetical protein
LPCTSSSEKRVCFSLTYPGMKFCTLQGRPNFRRLGEFSTIGQIFIYLLLSYVFRIIFTNTWTKMGHIRGDKKHLVTHGTVLLAVPGYVVS